MVVINCPFLDGFSKRKPSVNGIPKSREAYKRT